MRRTNFYIDCYIFDSGARKILQVEISYVCIYKLQYTLRWDDDAEKQEQRGLRASVSIIVNSTHDGRVCS